ncbi:MAG: AraC family transcriptional regulator [Lentisphaeria bacterium]|nr:AraC family transcriptional regulator [Lentisphaeria bacterium]
MDHDTSNIFNTAPQIRNFRVIEYSNIYSVNEHIPKEHELLYVLDGRITLHVEDHLVFQAMPGDFLLVESNTRHRDEFALLKGLRIMLLQFFWQNDDFFRIVNNRTLVNLSYDTRNEIRRRLDFLRANWEDTPDYWHHASIQLHGILLLFYFDLQKNLQHAEQHILLPLQEAMQKAKHFLDQNYAEPLSLKQTAKHIGISPAYLSRIFHHEYGISFSEYLTSLRLDAARQLLQTTRLQIAEIANRCGFSSSSYFIKVFSDHYKVTPRNYAAETRSTGSSSDNRRKR